MIREDRRRGVFVDGLSEWVVRSPAEVYGLMMRGAQQVGGGGGCLVCSFRRQQQQEQLAYLRAVGVAGRPGNVQPGEYGAYVVRQP